MSADNTIIVLVTNSTWEHKPNGYSVRVPPYRVYRVAHIQAWDNYDWYLENQPYNLGAYLMQCFKNAPAFRNEDEAMNYAKKMQEEIHFVEYGIQVVDTPFTYFGD